jgi:hypothetical protein
MKHCSTVRPNCSGVFIGIILCEVVQILFSEVEEIPRLVAVANPV